MADDLHYVPGDFYRIDDRSGFKVRAKKQRKEWTGLIVEEKLWEIRHPQDFVKGVIDDQTVPEPRSRSAQDVFVAFIQSTVAVFAAQGTTRLTLTNATGFNVGDVVEVMLDTNELFRTTLVTTVTSIAAPSDNYIYFQNIMLFQIPPVISLPPGNIVTLANPLPYHVSVGNIIEDLTDANTVQPVTASNIV